MLLPTGNYNGEGVFNRGRMTSERRTCKKYWVFVRWSYASVENALSVVIPCWMGHLIVLFDLLDSIT